MADRQEGGLEFSSVNTDGSLRIESGDTLGKIVKAELGEDATAESINARIQEYKIANEGLNPDQIRVGQTLNIPEGEPNILSNLSDWVGAEVNEIKTSAIGLATATEGVFDHVTGKAQSLVSNFINRDDDTLTVRSGDTLGEIVKVELGEDATSASINARIQEYKDINEGLNPDQIRVGQSINIPEGGSSFFTTLSDRIGADVNALKTVGSNLARSSEELFDSAADSGESFINGLLDKQSGTLIVKSGDTLSRIIKEELGESATTELIAARIQEYKEANEGLNPHQLGIGQELNIPEGDSSFFADFSDGVGTTIYELKTGAEDLGGDVREFIRSKWDETKDLFESEPDFFLQGQMIKLGAKRKEVVQLQESILAAGDGGNIPEIENLKAILSNMKVNSGYFGESTKLAYRALIAEMDPIGLSRVQQLNSKSVFDIRMSGDKVSIGEYALRSVDIIRDQVGFDYGKFVNLSVNDVAKNLDQLQDFVLNASNNYPKVSPELLNAIVTIESRGMINAVSATGALGVMQITSQNYINGKYNPFNPEEAIKAGASLLSGYIKKYGNDQDGLNKSYAAYNQGPGAVNNAINKSVQNNTSNWVQYLPVEGVNYIDKINSTLHGDNNIPGYFGN